MINYSLREMLDRIDEPNRSLCIKMITDHPDVFLKAKGSRHNHQVWEGGYLDHIRETMNIGIDVYETLSLRRPLTFSLSDLLLVIFLHDLEKPWRNNTVREFDKVARHHIRMDKIDAYNIKLTEDQLNALIFAEGEGDSYSGRRRAMGPLAAMVHVCDVISARIWFDHPTEEEGRGLAGQYWDLTLKTP